MHSRTSSGKVSHDFSKKSGFDKMVNNCSSSAIRLSCSETGTPSSRATRWVPVIAMFLNRQQVHDDPKFQNSWQELYCSLSLNYNNKGYISWILKKQRTGTAAQKKDFLEVEDDPIMERIVLIFLIVFFIALLVFPADWFLKYRSGGMGSSRKRRMKMKDEGWIETRCTNDRSGLIIKPFVEELWLSDQRCTEALCVRILLVGK